MSQQPQHLPPLFRIDVSADSAASVPETPRSPAHEIADLLRQMLAGQQRQNALLEEMIQQFNAAQKQRANELGQWKEANPKLARNCRAAAEALGRVQNEFLDKLTEDINDNVEDLLDGDFMLNEFVDRYGPRLAHLNGVLQVLSQLSSVASPANTTQ